MSSPCTPLAPAAVTAERSDTVLGATTIGNTTLRPTVSSQSQSASRQHLTHSQRSAPHAPRSGRHLWRKLRALGCARIARSRDRGLRHWETLREIGCRRIVERLVLSSMWEEAEAVEAAENRKAVEDPPQGELPGLRESAATALSQLPVFFWRRGRERELGRGVRRTVHSAAGFAQAQVHKLDPKSALQLRPRVVRWGRRPMSEPMLLSTVALLVPVALLLSKNRTFLCAMHVVALVAAVLHHKSGEARRWLHQVHLCPLTFTLPSLVVTFAASSVLCRAVVICFAITCAWLYMASGHPGTFSYEKYHLLWHWAWVGAHVFAALSLPYAR